MRQVAKLSKALILVDVFLPLLLKRRHSDQNGNGDFAWRSPAIAIDVSKRKKLGIFLQERIESLIKNIHSNHEILTTLLYFISGIINGLYGLVTIQTNQGINISDLGEVFAICQDFWNQNEIILVLHKPIYN